MNFVMWLLSILFPPIPLTREEKREFDASLFYSSTLRDYICKVVVRDSRGKEWRTEYYDTSTYMSEEELIAKEKKRVAATFKQPIGGWIDLHIYESKHIKFIEMLDMS